MDELRHHAEARRLLAALLCEPDAAVFREEDVVPRLNAALAMVSPGHEVPDLDPDGGGELLVAFTKLFLGPGRIPAPPYGSVYLDPEGLVAGPSTQAVRAFYAEEGLGVENEAAELPDHAAIELEFSAHLLDKAAAIAVADERAGVLRRHEEFDSRFLSSWLPEFGRRIQEAGLHPVYDAVGAALRELPPVGGRNSEAAS